MSLRRLSPPVWRRLLVAEDTPLGRLHDILHASFGWSEDYYFEFRIRGRRFVGADIAGWKAAGYGDVDIPLTQFRLESRERFAYVYDLAVSWQADVRVEGRTVAVAADLPVCTAMRGVGPPETSRSPGDAMDAWDRGDPGCLLWQVQELVEDDTLDDVQLRHEVAKVLETPPRGEDSASAINRRLRALTAGHRGQGGPLCTCAFSSSLRVTTATTRRWSSAASTGVAKSRSAQIGLQRSR